MLMLEGLLLVFCCRDAALLPLLPLLLFFPPVNAFGDWQGATDTCVPRWDFLGPRGFSGTLLDRLSLVDPVTFPAWLPLPGDPLRSFPLPRGLRPDLAWLLLEVDRVDSAGVFCVLQVWPLELVPLWVFFL